MEMFQGQLSRLFSTCFDLPENIAMEGDIGRMIGVDRCGSQG